MREDIGIIGIGLYIPKGRMSAKDISLETKGIWSEEAVINKLGIKEKPMANDEEGTQEMALLAAKEAINDYNIDPLSIDVILSMGEEWKEYPLSTTALYLQGELKAKNAWGIDLQNRCCTTLSAIKIAKDMLIADDEINTILIAGGYRNSDFVDYSNPKMSMMYNLSCGGGAIILKKGVKENLILGSHIIGDGSLSRDVHVKIGGIHEKITKDNIDDAYKSLNLINPDHMKDRLNQVSMPNWFKCIDKALEKSKLKRENINYLGVLHFKKSMHDYLLKELNLSENQSIYLENYGHMGQVDQILSLKLALDSKKLKKGDNALLIAAGIGYVWAASVIRWG